MQMFFNRMQNRIGIDGLTQEISGADHFGPDPIYNAVVPGQYDNGGVFKNRQFA